MCARMRAVNVRTFEYLESNLIVLRMLIYRYFFVAKINGLIRHPEYIGIQFMQTNILIRCKLKFNYFNGLIWLIWDQFKSK